MGLKIREADTMAELKEMRQKVMEMETQNHVCTINYGVKTKNLNGSEMKRRLFTVGTRIDKSFKRTRTKIN